MVTDINEKLAALLLGCRDEQKTLRDEIKRLQTQLAEMERQHKMMHMKGYQEGYQAGIHDARRK